ncbi:hypothetical protein FF38_05732 [Lucilia cuprina]|uniref:Uncharacterized protein n=1 Tax=Lucilia cuprina TaxID=7375 RepID=A0A0L0CAN3_LUCCU|nr:hypothetical protein FF38_05732 [Lucilia cuprina]
MAVCEAQLDTSGFYYTALDTLMDSLHISSTPNLEPARCSNNSFRRHFSTVDEEKFFSFCSTIKQHPKSDNVVKEKRSNTNSKDDNKQNNATTTPTRNARDTPKRSLTTTRKQKLFANTETTEEFKPKSRTSRNDKDLSPQTLLLKKAITRFECLQRRQERIALSKKPIRTSLRV